MSNRVRKTLLKSVGVFICLMFKTRIKIPLHLLRDTSVEDVEDYLLIKQCYSNGIIYDPRIHVIQKRLRENFSLRYTQTRLAKLLRMWKNLGWVTEHKNGVIYFASNKGKKCKSVKLSDLRYELRKHIILSKFRQMEFARNTKKNLKYPRGAYAYLDHKRAKRNRKKINGDTSRFDLDLMWGYRTIGEYLKVSSTTAYNTISRMIEEGCLIKYKAKFFIRRVENLLTRTPNGYVLVRG